MMDFRNILDLRRNLIFTLQKKHGLLDELITHKFNKAEPKQ